MSFTDALTKALSGLPTTARATSFDDESIKSNRVESYKAKAGNTDRICILDPRLVVVGRSHYGGEGVGYVLCKSTYKMEGSIEVLDRKALCCTHMGEPKLGIVVPIAKYQTKPTGEPIKPLSVDYLVWRINDERFGQLRMIHKEWGLDKHDLIVTCEDETYQRVNVALAKERILAHEQVKAKFDEEVAAFLLSIAPKLTREIGSDVSDEDLLKKLGKAGPVTSTTRVSDAPVGDIGDLLG